MALDVIVLAAGLGKRMRSDLPKVLHPLAGRPLLAHVIDAARALAPRKIFVVHGHGADRVRAAFPDSGVDWVLQAQQLGTGHAVLQASPQDAAAAELASREVHAGFFCLSARRLVPWLSKISNDNAQEEYYLTDLVALAVANAVPVVAVKVEDQWEVAGANSMQELAVLE